MLDYGIIGNCKTCALVSNKGSIEWMCYPIFDSPSVFAKLLDTKKGGSFNIITKNNFKIKQEYIKHSAIIKTTFKNRTEQFEIIDFFPRYKSEKKNKLYLRNQIVRIINPINGRPEIRVQLDPKLNYARGRTFSKVNSDHIQYKNKDLELDLYSNIDLKTIKSSNYFELDSSKFIEFGGNTSTSKTNLTKIRRTYKATLKYWKSWCDSLKTPDKNKDVIIRSAITLKLLTFSRMGTMVAAPTTSIPEEIKSNRCWDYRFCWVRDSSLAADALKKIGRKRESKKLLKFLVNKVLEDNYIQIMYGINGEFRLTEQKLNHLEGYKSSKPVRVGNAAFFQKQNDVWGEIIDIMYLYYVYYKFEPIPKRALEALKFLVNQIKHNWFLKDNGIWEFRGRQRHYVHSKLMCYVGIDRAIRILNFANRKKEISEWKALAEEIKQDIIEKGFNKKENAFTIAYKNDNLDAAVLLMCYHEFLPKDNPLLIATVNKIYDDLRNKCFVQRYTMKDDFGKSKSAFTICTFWLIDALYYIGETKKAREIYKEIMKYSNHLGLFSEDINLETKSLIGNFPQAYTHIAIINSSILLSEWDGKRRILDLDSNLD